VDLLTPPERCVQIDGMETEPGERIAAHPIGVVSERTGLSPDVLRVWERRYGVVEPVRGGGGQRLYSDADVERLKLLRLATQAGRGIGQVAGLSGEELARLVQDDRLARLEPPAVAGGGGLDVEAAIGHAKRLDPDGLERLLRHAAVVAGAVRFLENGAAPFLRRLGEEWHAGRLSVAQEHVATGVVRRVVHSMMDSMVRAEGAPGLLVGTTRGERHEMGGLLVAAAAAAEGWRVIYLGPDLPAAEIAEAAVSSRARSVAVSVVFAEDVDGTAAEIVRLRELLPESVGLLVGGGGAAAVADAVGRPGVLVLGDLEALRQTLRTWPVA
jgi:MerR family transcriptional regulator, light-induced transcriptional regulator